MKIERNTLVVEGLDIAYGATGSGPPVVLIHGALTGLEDGLISLAPHLAPHHRVVSFDRPGNGLSARGWRTGSLWRQATLIREAVVALGLERPVLVGHSFGGGVAMAYALQYPDDLAGVVAVAPVAFPEFRLEHLLFAPRATPLAGGLLSFAAMGLDQFVMPLVWRTMFLPQEMPEAFAEAFPVNEAGERSRMRAAAEEASFVLSDLSRAVSGYAGCSTPVRVFVGDRDKVANPNVHGRPLARAVRDGRCTMLAGAGHMLHHFAPETVVAAVSGLHGQTRVHDPERSRAA